MKEQYFKEFFEKSPTAYSYHKVILDDQGIPYDYEFLQVNEAYENMMGLKAYNVVGKRFKEVFPPDNWQEPAKWYKAFQDAVIDNKTVNVEMQHYLMQKWLRITMFPLSKYNFACILNDVTKEYMKEKEIEGFLKVNPDVLCAADTDELTGLLNRHFFDKRVVEEMERSDRHNEPLSMLIMDLNHFKIVNDTWSHAFEDEVLKQTAEIASSIIRKSDILVRLGGEEFAVLMPQTTTNSALEVAERIREALGNNIYPINVKHSASFVVAERIKSESFKSWYKRIDEALYHAKEVGRNRVVSADDQERLPVVSVDLEWKSEWGSGSKNIDEQHQELLEVANILIYMSLSDVKFEKVLHQLDILINHIVQHFNYEEKVIVNIGYPDYERHSKIHENLVAKVLQLRESYQNGELKPSAFFSFIVDDAIIGHMLNDDVQFFPYTRKKDTAGMTSE